MPLHCRSPKEYQQEATYSWEGVREGKAYICFLVYKTLWVKNSVLALLTVNEEELF